MFQPARIRNSSIRLLTVLTACGLLTAAWAGPQEVVKDGVPHVMNSERPSSKAETVKMKELWRVGGEDDEEIFGVITAIVEDDDGDVYMLDSQLSEVKVYSGDGEWDRTIGREGEGPGEFRSAFNMFLVPGGNIGVLQAFPPKIVTLTPDGEPADDFKIPETEGEGFRVLFQAANAGDKLALVYGMNQPSEAGFTQSNVLSVVDAKAQSEVKLHSESSTMQAATAMISEKEWDVFRNGRWAAAADGRIFAATEYGKYSINVWDGSGSLTRVIEREYPEHARSAEEKQRILDIYKGFTRRIPIPNIKYEIEDIYNQIGSINARDDGSLWVRTSRGTFDVKDGLIGTWDVFDKNGHFVRQVSLAGDGDPQTDGLFFVGDRLYVVTDFLNAMMALQGGPSSEEEEEEEEVELMEVIAYELPL